MPDEEGVASVERAISILEALGDERLSLSELAARTGLYKSTLLRLCKSLERFQYVFRHEDGSFRLGSKLMALGSAYQRSFRTAEVVMPVLRDMAKELREGASFYVRDRDERVCLHRVEAARAVRDSVHEGDRLPLSIGAAAHVIVAFSGATEDRYARIRHEMYAASYGERDGETAAVACPVFGIDDKFVGALSVSGPRYRIEAMGEEIIVPVLFRSGRLLTRTLGGNPDAPEFAMWSPARQREPAECEP